RQGACRVLAHQLFARDLTLPVRSTRAVVELILRSIADPAHQHRGCKYRESQATESAKRLNDVGNAPGVDRVIVDSPSVQIRARSHVVDEFGVEFDDCPKKLGAI